MSLLDFWIFGLYVAGTLAISVVLSRTIKNADDYFAAGRQSNWWLSGLSGFMTMFSAGTFVVWGGIAFKWGMVAVSIAMCLGISALLVGYQLAGLWRRSGVSTAAEFIHLRFGLKALKFYTWFNIVYRLLGMAVALYSLAIMLAALLPQGLRGISISEIIIFCGVVVVVYTLIGGLWAVLLTDVLQFIVLLVAVSIVIPLALGKMGGVEVFISETPEGFFRPVSGEFSWLFLVGWVVIHYFKIGGEWAFVQRYICVPKASDARKAAWLFGLMYLISPIIWMLPPMMYRVIDPSANPEQAYILTCQYALPEGLMGLLIASMFAATGSMIDSELNVFSGVLTRDFYKRIFPDSTEKRQILVGQLLTLALGVLVIILAILVPLMGGAQEIILSITALLAGPMVLPVIWGLYSEKINEQSVFITIFVSGFAALVLKFGWLNQSGWFVSDSPAGWELWLQQHARTLETVLGTLVPFFVLFLIENTQRHTAGWNRTLYNTDENSENIVPPAASLFPGKVVAIVLAALATLFCFLAFSGDSHQVLLTAYSVVLGGMAGLIFYFIRMAERKAAFGVVSEKTLVEKNKDHEASK
ncbi:MAG: sodium:solute symporter family protein [Bacteroidia bacterium]